jgi:hypothetical protein
MTPNKEGHMRLSLLLGLAGELGTDYEDINICY